jgi:membrane protein YqaA with SNARE-associated domain
MLHLILLFLVVFLLNIIPAFAPPTWMVFSFIGFVYPSRNGILLALVGAAAATLGRVTLAKMSRVVVRQKLMSAPARENIDVLRARLEKRRKLTVSAFLLYAFTPLPSNFLFIAYGMTAMKLKLIAIPFFMGRSVSYSFWTLTASAAARRLAFESTEALPYWSVYFLISQTLVLFMIYLFSKLDWRALFSEKKLKWMSSEQKVL